MTPEQFDAVAAYVKNAIVADEREVKPHRETALWWWLVRLMGVLGEVASTPMERRTRHLALFAKIAAIAMRAIWQQIKDFAYLPEEDEVAP